MRAGRRCAAALLLAALGALLGPVQAPAAAGRPKRPEGPLLTFVSTEGGERSVEAEADFAFVAFERTYYTRHAPRSEASSGQRVDVEDRRRECACLRLQDYSRIKFKKLRQVEIIYPSGGRATRLRLTDRVGRVREIPAESLYGGDSPLPPRFAVTIDGESREFPLILGDEASGPWPEERLVRVLLVRAPPPRR